MSPEAQRIAIAAACGWQRMPQHDYTSHADPLFAEHGERVEMWGKESGQLIPKSKLPDYLNDLNAMHEAEKFIPGPNWSDYVCFLCVPGSDLTGKLPDGIYLYWGPDYVRTHADAPQRADAFLRALGLMEVSA